ncbi:hypothetical protein ASPZODRAFT_167556 [Penicilliopsis zonata CBS 506.65]|uniref:PNPLA domain-containing protein n=1 Tax=Penicilliopsis zonata CBS 506.65 TaxID=1073090 RepID=A0A1L9SFB3_9EURO|nr:hypothetical protein ASPZODRAFT_167556 [Penicilliopsis zonata CBS 506.65]OJJ45838.1 hypothetical protein ASPZODRAFT_167556 [Penicilliopsis zonata CBS 506.65]
MSTLPTSLRELPAWPIRALDDDSIFPEGKFVVDAPECKDETEPLVWAEDGTVATETWFTTPPLSRSAILGLKSVQLFAETRDQGYVDDRALGNWTWLELAIYENEEADSPRVREGVQLVWTSHRNDMGSKEYDWLSGDGFGEQHDLLNLLQPGNVIAVRVCACFRGWELYGRAARLVLRTGPPTRIEPPPSYTQVIEETLTLQHIMNCINVRNDAYEPTITAAWDRADTYSGKELRPLRVLSLDGGGVRGYSSLMLLKEVMDRGAPNKKPCDVFDLIGGTSTGGLIAIMLGRLKMTVQECLDEYDALMKEVFGSGWFHKHIGKTASYIQKSEFYSAEKLEKVIKALLRKRLPAGEDPENALLLDNDNPCKIFLMAVREESGSNRGPVFLRSYLDEREKPDADLANIKLWQAARATSAAPAYFKPLQVGNVKLVDGGLLANNPFGWLWFEVLGVFGPTRETDCFLSIGTGMAANVAVAQPGFLFKDAMMSFSSLATNTESTHLLFRTLVDAFAPCPQAKKYFRLNVSKELPEPDDHQGIFAVFFGKKKEEVNLKDYEDPGSLDDVDVIPKLKEWTKEWIAGQHGLIKACGESIARNLAKKG